MISRLLAVTILLAALVLSYAWLGATGFLGEPQPVGDIHQQPVPATVQAARQAQQQSAFKAVAENAEKQILFGDFHVHTTWSNDAYVASLPISGGEGSHPPADACDYARYCSGLDFWSINDHAISLNQRRWREIKESVRQCNAVSGEENPDVVAFLGYEWTQADPTNANSHYGHKNVIFRHTDEERVAKRPIYAETDLGPAAFNPTLISRMMLPLQKWRQQQIYQDWNLYMAEMESEPDCPHDVSSDLLPVDCKEGARSPADLFRKLAEQGHESLVIPHGNTWGMYTPPNITWDKQLAGANQNEQFQYLIEVFSGHGNSEEYRAFNDRAYDPEGKVYCPAPSPDYLPTCVQAGRIVRQRCMSAGETAAECDRRELMARQYAVESDYPLATVPRSEPNDWLDAGQCRDCFLPAYTFRPGGSAQYALALGNFDDPDTPRRFRFGFLASSDNHTARPGTGYKERNRRHNVEGFSLADKFTRDFLMRKQPGPVPFSVPVESDVAFDQGLLLTHAERASSFYLTGGLVAVHAPRKDRDAIWNAVQSKETYGTSGDRILLWFDLLNAGAAGGQLAPMGSEVSLSENPRFQVRAVGALRQRPGCPDSSVNALGQERLARLCYGECFNPGDERKLITRIEVVRIRPQTRPGEPISGLIEDTWLTHHCPPDPNGCQFDFEDPDFNSTGRETVYYVRAIEEASEAVNAALMRCQYDDNGHCTSANICAGSPLFTDPADDCLASNEERAWSSPIFVSHSE
ncbi:DUF3604 domain-containing protein [Halieaceae bacterium IMCC14734]|uniref:DUF3604 domain-containing protein n=1 Tax=Candidatus Litorirhabdus singularis TaxID=2518993 RepID=A0ABT3TH58_9GAMM|nr:DUF3604 domain-containing protein [Candidatus Litorirhabdus singularis]MCX2981540.1 DUF3604 domain-containing protein [Candidatus Litorirhabdus singularis]